MRYSQEHKARTHQRIIKEAASRFRRDGIGATGLQPLMRALGLTHGGFYAHFRSKNELVERALQEAAGELNSHCEDLFSGSEPLPTFIDSYLSEWHRSTPEQGCPLTTMSCELGQRRAPCAITDNIINTRLEQISEVLGPKDSTKSLVILATLVGALILSRSAKDQDLAINILSTTRRYLKTELKKAGH